MIMILNRNKSNASSSLNIVFENFVIKTLGALFVCVEVLRPCQQLRACRAGQLPINTVPGQA